MKKINSNYNNKYPIIFLIALAKHVWLYQSENPRHKIWFFNTDYGGSVFVYFRDCGIKDSKYLIAIDKLATIRSVYAYYNDAV